MAIEVSDRYASPRMLADDIEHWLADEPISCIIEPVAIRARRWMNRHRTLVAASAAAITMLMTGLVVLLVVVAGHNRTLDNKNRQLDEANFQLAQANVNLRDANRSESAAKERAEQREQVAIDAVKRFRDAVANNPDLKNNPALDALRKSLLKEPLSFFRELRERLEADGDTRPESMARLALAAHELGELTKEIGDYQDALNAVSQSVEIFENLARDNPTVTEFQSNLAVCNCALGVLLSQTGQLVDALTAYEAAFKVQEKLARDNPTVSAFQSNLAGSHYQIGDLLWKTGKAVEALTAYEAALKIFENLARENPTDHGIRANLAISHRGIGTRLSEMGRPIEAMTAYEAAVEILENLARDNPAVTSFQETLAESYNNISNLLISTGKSVEALTALEAARQILEKLARQSPTVTELQSKLATIQNNIGILHCETGKNVEALTACQAALRIREKLARENVTVTAFQTRLAESHITIGTLLMTTGNRVEALTALEAALKILDKLESEHHELPELSSNLGAALNNMALLDLRAQRFAEASDRFKEAIVWQTKALAAIPNHATFRQFLSNHYTNLRLAAVGLNDPLLAAEAELGLAKLNASAPVVASVDQRLAAVLSGELVQENSERLILARRAYETRRFAAAAKLFAQAFDSDPTLTNDRQTQHAYNAACVAALAGIAQGVDVIPDEAERARLRSQARGWLQAELYAWSEILKSATAEERNAVARILMHWQSDSNLAGVRGEAIDALPESERASWHTLWDRVAEIIDAASTARP